MSEPMDELQQRWRKPEGLSDREVNLVIRLIQEKGNAFRDAVKARNHALMILGLTLAFFLLLISRTARWPWVGPGYGLLGVSGLVGATVTWMWHRRRAAPDRGMEIRLYCELLLSYYDSQIRFVRTLNRWCAPPFCIGIALLGFGFWQHNGSVAWMVVLGILAPLWCWVSFEVYGVRGANQVRQQKSRVALILAEIGEGSQP